MEHNHDRRVPGVRRVPVERVVDICAGSSPASAFQGRSVNVSGRGMHVRSSHLPELHAPLVLRFQEQGAEIIAEGEVAWRSEGPRSGEFGVRFTALDSRSVQALKALCQADAELGSEPGLSEEHDTDPAPPASAGVNLHIAGLAAPMHAEVKRTDRRSLEVSSPLEFLRVGRNLEVEDLALGGRRVARIEAVEVAVDESSRIPELRVSVRYADVAETPPPPQSRGRRVTPRVDASRSAPPVEVSPRRAEASSARAPRVVAEPFGLADDEQAYDDEPARATPAVADAEHPFSEGTPDWEDAPEPAGASGSSDPHADEPRGMEDDEEGLSEGDRLRERLDGVLGGLSSAARVAGNQCRRFGDAAARGTARLVSRARGATSAQPTRSPAPRRRTAAPPRATSRSNSPRQQPRLVGGAGRASQDPPPRPRPRGARFVALAGLLLTAALVGVLLGRGDPVEPSPVALAAPANATAATPAPALTVVPPDGNQPARTGGADEGSAAPMSAEEADLDDVLESPAAVARVPLFGPTLLVDDPAAPTRAAQAAPPEARALARVKASDRTFDDSAPPKPRSKGQAAEEFGSGRLHPPDVKVYRLRLDQPGESLRGERTPTGFDVVVVGRKAMEPIAEIKKRARREHKRIADVKAQNDPEGVRVSFEFKSTIPPYKVRLLKDFVEFSIDL